MVRPWCIVYSDEALHDRDLADDVHSADVIEEFASLPRFLRQVSLRVSGCSRFYFFFFPTSRSARCRQAAGALDSFAGTGPTSREEKPNRGAHTSGCPPTNRPSTGPSPLDENAGLQQVARHLYSAELEEPTRTAILPAYQQGLPFEEMAGYLSREGGRK